MTRNVTELRKKYKKQIDEGIATELERRKREVRELSSRLSEVLEAMCELSRGGKRLRGMLTVLGYQMGEGSLAGKNEVIKAAVAMEIFHLGLLIQDDFMDRDVVRRGVKTIQMRYRNRHLGEAMAVLAGDYTFGWVTEILAGLKLPENEVLQAMGVWGKYFSRVGYGQSLDMLGSERKATENEILKISKLKSGEYSCVLPLLLGASLAGASENKKKRLVSFGLELGWVFQLRDDWLSEYGESKKTGKPVGNDRREGKKTLATIYGKTKLEKSIGEHKLRGFELLRGVSSKYREVMGEMFEEMATRES